MWWLSSASSPQGMTSCHARHMRTSAGSKVLTICITTITFCIPSRLKILLRLCQKYVGIMEESCNFTVLLPMMASTINLDVIGGGVITLQKLIEELKYAKGITFQYFFGTERALKTLKTL